MDIADYVMWVHLYGLHTVYKTHGANSSDKNAWLLQLIAQSLEKLGLGLCPSWLQRQQDTISHVEVDDVHAARHVHG